MTHFGQVTDIANDVKTHEFRPLLPYFLYFDAEVKPLKQRARLFLDLFLFPYCISHSRLPPL
jgi:hypothetical protein